MSSEQTRPSRTTGRAVGQVRAGSQQRAGRGVRAGHGWLPVGAVVGVLAAAAACGTGDTPAAGTTAAGTAAATSAAAETAAPPRDAVTPTASATAPVAPTATTSPVQASPGVSTAPPTGASAPATASPATSSAAPAGGGAPLPAGFVPAAFSATSTDRWSVLGTDARDRVQLVTTADGGSSWQTRPLPDAARGPVGGDGQPGIAFSDATHGLVTVGGGFWATSDGGRTWAYGGPGDAEVLQVAAGPGAGYALLRTAGGGYFLGRAAAGSVDLQQALGGSRFTTTVPHLATSGTTVVVVSGDRTLRSTDGGHTFSSSRGPCTADLGGQVAAAGPAVLAWCATGMQGAGFVSTDRGATFSRTGASGSNGAAAAPTGSGSTFAYAGADGLRLTDRTGAGRAARGGLGTVGWVGFTTPRTGFAIAAADGSTDQLWRSVDGGLSWTRVGAR